MADYSLLCTSISQKRNAATLSSKENPAPLVDFRPTDPAILFLLTFLLFSVLDILVLIQDSQEKVFKENEVK